MLRDEIAGLDGNRQPGGDVKRHQTGAEEIKKQTRKEATGEQS
jgi:hypothetical protein